MDTKGQLKKTYNKIAEEYGGCYRRKLFPEAVEFLKSIKPSFILDIGSGWAQYNKEIESFGHKLIISDFAVEQLRQAQKQGVRNPIVAFDATSIPIKSKSFDAVTSFAVFHHMSNHRDRLAFLSEIRRVLKTGGQAFIGIYGTKNSSFEGNMKFGKFDRYYYFFNRRDFQDILKEVFKDFDIIESETITTKDIEVNSKINSFELRNYFVLIKK